jgi:DNA-binding transcriptional LysR family regulator
MKDSDWKILDELYKTPNITKVANRLYITQPSLTKRLQGIEEEFQIKIVTRTTKGVEFTKEGEILAKKAIQYFSFMHQIRKELRELQESEKEIIVIGASYTYSKYVLTDLLFEYSKKHPNVRFEVQNEQSNLLFRKVCDGEVDVAFVRGDYDGPVNQEKVAVSQAHILTKEEVQIEMLPNMTRLDYKTNDRSKEILDNWWQQTFHEPAVAGMSVGYVDVAWQLVSKGLGYICCFLSEYVDDSYGLIKTPIYYMDGTPVMRNTWFCYKEKQSSSKALKDFIRYIQDYVTLGC